MRKLDCQETESPEALQAQLDAARDGLRNLDRNIRKMLGRDVSDGEGVPLQPPRLHIYYSLSYFRKLLTLLKKMFVIVFCKLKHLCI